MSKECGQDCVERLRFPRAIDNRAGLSRIRYRLGSYADIRAALLRGLDTKPGLAHWTYRGADDPGIALLEGASILGDILTFYQELYANEAFLRTAQWRESVAELVRLLGYRLSPGLGGRATFAFEVQGDEPVEIPAGFAIKAELADVPKPVDFETRDVAVAYPWLSRFHLYRRLFTPTFTPATTEFSIFSPDPYLTPIELKRGDRLLVGDANNATAPTRLSNAEIVIVDAVRELHGRKIYKIKGALKRTADTSSLTAFKIGRTFHHFGFNGARTFVDPTASVQSTSKASTTSGVTTTTMTSPGAVLKTVAFSKWLDSTTSSYDWAIDYWTYSKTTRIVAPDLAEKDFALDAEVRDLATGTRLVIEATLYDASPNHRKDVTLIRTITAIRSASLTWGLTTGSTSLVSLDQRLATVDGGVNYDIADLREFLMHEVLGPTLELRAGVRETTDPEGNELYFLGTDAQAQALADRRLMLIAPGADPEILSVVDVQALSAGVADRPLLRRITIDRDVAYPDFPNEKPSRAFYGNLVDATEGKRERAVPLGNGDSRVVFQTFPVPKAPVTYLISAGDTPPEVPELEIYVNDRLWTRVPSFFDRKSDEQIYIVREDAENHSWVQFGDGVTGARLPSGIKNVVAIYRTGTGAFGPLKPKAKVQPGKKLEGLDAIKLPGVVAGGSEPEDADSAREAAPGKIQSLDRLVSLEDFESETLAISGVTKASAAWQLVDNIPEVVITVLMTTGRGGEINDVRATLAAYNQSRGPGRFPITVLQGQQQYVVVAATFGFDSTYREEDVTAAIRLALGVTAGSPTIVDDPSGLFSVRRRRFGQREYATSIAGAIQRVDGVVWARVARFESLGIAADPAELLLSTKGIMAQPIVACDGQHVLSLYAGHLQLSGVSVTRPKGNR